MDELIIKEMNKRAILWIIGIVCAFVVIFFTGIGVYEAFWNVPAKIVKIADLTDQRDTWRARAKELDQYIETREEQYRVAHKFDQLAMLVADPNVIMRFEKLEKYIKDRKEFFKPVKVKK